MNVTPAKCARCCKQATTFVCSRCFHDQGWRDGNEMVYHLDLIRDVIHRQDLDHQQVLNYLDLYIEEMQDSTDQCKPSPGEPEGEDDD